MSIYMMILVVATVFSAFSQVLLKQSARREHANWIREYLNWRVITAYGISFAVLFANTYAYTGVDMRFRTADREYDHHFGCIDLYTVMSVIAGSSSGEEFKTHETIGHRRRRIHRREFHFLHAQGTSGG